MKRVLLSLACTTALIGGVVSASSHREAPLITNTPKVDATDLYMFRSYESGRSGFVTLIANYQPLQGPGDGPNYYQLDPKALYAIHIDNDGDAVEDQSFYFRFYTQNKKLTVPVGGKNVPVPLVNIGPFGKLAQEGNRNVVESYAVVHMKDRMGADLATNLTNGGNMFLKPFDNIGEKSIPNYAAYADNHISSIAIEGCATPGKVFVGQRKDGFAVNLGGIFDLINTNPLGPTNGETNSLANKGVTTLALELPISCLTNGSSTVIGAWTTAYLPAEDGHLRVVSRLGAPLVNEVVIGLPAKDKFNRSFPYDDAQFATYVTNPTLPILIQTLFPDAKAPTKYPRTDLVAAFLTGIEGLNKPANVRPAEMLRLNTATPVKTAATQNTLGVIAGDNAGFPNGRRPGDDVVDIELRVAMGVLLPEADAPAGQLPFTDGVAVKGTDFRTKFPYLNTPLPGAQN